MLPGRWARSHDDAEPAPKALHAAGASAHVQLRRDDKRLLVEVIDIWAKNVPLAELPDGIRDLRSALLNDLRG